MSDILDKLEVLKLNKLHDPIRLETPRSVFGDLTSYMRDKRGRYILDSKGNKQLKMLAYDIEFEQNPDGSYNFQKPIYDTMRLVDWDTWITLPIRPYDIFVSTCKQKVRIPRVVMSMHYAEMPTKRFSLNFNTMYELYDGTCAYTKRKLKRYEANLDHKIPRSKGGKTTFENMVLCDQRINAMKGDRYNHEVGLPDVPAIIPEKIPMVNFLKNDKGVPEWNLFLKKHERHY